MTEDPSVVVIGGCGHVGLPLGIALANSGLRTALFDTNGVSVDLVNSATMPFLEPGAEVILPGLVRDGMLAATLDASAIDHADIVIMVIGTPIGEHFNPDLEAVPRALKPLLAHLRNGQLFILRSTVYPGVTAHIERLLEEHGLRIDVAFCPERIAEGRAMVELHELPQIVAGRSHSSSRRAAALFGRLTKKIIHLTPEEAELAKLFTNAWRYLKFGIANQLFMIANDLGIDYEHVRSAIAEDYPRARDLPRAGFAAGPCLFKDTMQLAAFHAHNFTLGHAAMMVNEGLPLYVVSRIEATHKLETMTVGILGMAFKAESDDTRSSLSYKLKRILQFRAREVLTTDPHVTTDPQLLPLDDVIERADLLIVAAPHLAYQGLATDKPIIDIWGSQGAGVKF